MKIGILVYDIGLTGGAEKVAEQMAIQIGKYHEVILITVIDSLEVCREKNYDTISLSKKTVSITKNLLQLSMKLKKIIKLNGIDIIISITAGVVSLACLAAANTSVKVIYTEHSNLENKSYGKKHQLRQLIGAKCSDSIVTLTERDKENFINYYSLKPQKVRRIPNWFTPSVKAGEYDTLSQSIISVGRLETVKGYDLLLKAAKKVYEKCPDWHWDIYGDGSLRNEIQNDIKSLGLENFITLKGNVSNLSSVYSLYSFFVMTSRFEGFPLGLLEALSAGLPCISFDCPTGPAEIVDHGINGILVPAYNTDALADAIIELIRDKNERKEYASNADTNLSRYSLEAIIPEWLKLFDDICQ